MTESRRPLPQFLVLYGKMLACRSELKRVGFDFWHFGFRPRLGVNRRWHVLVMHERRLRDDEPVMRWQTMAEDIQPVTHSGGGPNG